MTDENRDKADELHSEEDTSDEAYEDGSSDIAHDLWLWEAEYKGSGIKSDHSETNLKESPSLLVIANFWIQYRSIGMLPSDWLLKEIDKHFETISEREGGRRKKDRQMNRDDYRKIQHAENTREALKEYREREGLSSLDTVRKRMTAFEKRHPIFSKTLQKKKEEKT